MTPRVAQAMRAVDVRKLRIKPRYAGQKPCGQELLDVMSCLDKHDDRAQCVAVIDAMQLCHSTAKAKAQGHKDTKNYHVQRLALMHLD